MTEQALPSVDLQDLYSDDPTRLDRAASALLEGYSRYGLVTIAGHGLDRDRVDDFYDTVRAFFAQDEEAKRPFNRPEIWFQRGWTPPNTEQAVVAGGQPDFKECFFAAPMPLDERAKAMYPELYADNLWPDNIPHFTERYLTLGKTLHEVGQTLLTGCERALKLDNGTFAAITSGAAHVTRALSYLPVSQEQLDAKVLWGEEHTDFNLLTILAGGRFYTPDGERTLPPDPQSGLYLRTPASPEHPRGQMIHGVAPKGHILSQVGQQLEILTGGVLQATPHVIKAPRQVGYTRASVAHFVHSNAFQTLSPLAPFRTPEANQAYRPPVLAGNYSLKTLVDIALAPAEELDALGYRQYGRLEGIREAGEW